MKKPVHKSDEQTQLVVEMFKAKCVQFGDFTLASGKKSPIYIDLRRVISYPELMNFVVKAYLEEINKLHFDLLAAVPYAALPVAANIALLSQKTMVYPRKEVKTHGTGKMVEGSFQSGQRALVIEDVITTGSSVMTATETLQKEGLIIEDALVLVDRQQGGEEALEKGGIYLHAIVTIRRIMDILLQEKCVSQAVHASVLKYLNDDQST